MATCTSPILPGWCDQPLPRSARRATRLGFDPRDRVELLDWLATPTQRLAEVTGGAVFHDGLGELVPARERLRWYPPDVWRYVLAAQWSRIAEEEPFVGRCSELGDTSGGRIVVDMARCRAITRAALDL
jgi:hypothetical protein